MSDSSSIRAPRILVMGVGSSGSRAVAVMCQLDSNLNAVAVDTDTKVLEALPMKRTIHIGGATEGMSTGLDIEVGRQAVEKNSTAIRNQLKGVNLLVVVTGLGGGTGSGAVPVITRLAHGTGALVLCLASMPFKLEGNMPTRIAEDALKRIRTHADAIVRIPNERLLDRADADLTAEQIFPRGHQVMSDAVFALCRMISQNGVCDLDFACIQTMLSNCDGFCHFASAVADGEERASTVADGIIKHPLMAKGTLLAGASGMIIGLTGGQDLKMSEIEGVMERIQEKLPADVWLNFGVTIEPEYEGRLSAVVLVAEQWKEPLVGSSGRQIDLRYGGAQGELPLETVGKGRFTNLDPTILGNQDLDVPAYVRRDIKLPR